MLIVRRKALLVYLGQDSLVLDAAGSGGRSFGCWVWMLPARGLLSLKRFHFFFFVCVFFAFGRGMNERQQQGAS